MLTSSEYRLVAAEIENKCGEPFTEQKLFIYRSQLVTYMIGLAIQNQVTPKSYDYGLSPIFYKMCISKDYLENKLIHEPEQKQQNNQTKSIILPNTIQSKIYATID